MAFDNWIGSVEDRFIAPVSDFETAVLGPAVPAAYGASACTPHDVALADEVQFYDYDWIDTPWVVLDTDASHGTVVLQPGGSYTYQPNYHYVGTDFFTYHATDGLENSDPATVTIDVTDEAPVAGDDGVYMTLRGIGLEVAAPGVLGNDTDAEPDELEAVLNTTPMHGYLEWLDAEGGFRYYPDTYIGTDTFTYKAYDQIDYSDPATVTIEVADIQLYSVYFEDDNKVTEDPGTTPEYDGPEWLDADLDGDADDPGDHKWPVAYTRTTATADSFLKVSATFGLSEPWQGGEILIRAEGPDNINIPATVAVVADRSVDIINVQATNPFPGEVRHYDDFNLDWQASSDGGATWIDVNTSSNDLYLTLKDPAVSPLYHTVVHLGSHNAQGQTTEDGTITDVWNNVFDGNSVTRVDGMPLWFYRTYGTQIATTAGLLTPQGEEGTKYGEGMCGAWVELMLDVLKAQGISRENDRVVIVRNGAGGFFVKNWHFDPAGGHSDSAIESFAGGHNRAAVVAEYPYFNIAPMPPNPLFEADGTEYLWIYPDVETQPGIEGKGPNSNPASWFYRHVVLELQVAGTTAWYDPSYGSKYSGATKEARELAFENTVVAGYFAGAYAWVREAEINTDLDGDDQQNNVVYQAVYMIKGNPTTSDEITSGYGQP